MNLLYLLGTIHNDIKGPERLRKFLDFTKPMSIAIEIDEERAKRIVECYNESIRELKEYELILKYLKGKETFHKISEYIYMKGYEISFSEHFARNNPKTSLLYLDDFTEEQVSELIGEIFEDKVEYSIEDILKLTSAECQKDVDTSYDDNSIKKFRKQKPEIFEQLMIERDTRIELRIREVFQSANQDLVYIGGNFHFFAGYHNLYERLRDLDPIRVKLRDVDQY